MSYAPPTRTAGEIMQAAKRQFGDESGVQLSDADLIGWINDAQVEIVSRNKILKAKSTAAAVAGQKTYTFPTLPIHQIESLHFAGRRIPNVTFAQAEDKIFSLDPDMKLDGPPQLWYEWAGTFTFWPTPDSSEPIDIYYTAVPKQVADAQSKLSVPDRYFSDVLRFVLQQAYEMDEDWQASQTKEQQFASSVNDKAEEERTAQNMTYDTITVYDL